MRTCDLMSAAEAAVRLSVSRERIVRWIQSGTLSGECLAGRWFVRRKDIERMQLHEREQEKVTA